MPQLGDLFYYIPVPLAPHFFKCKVFVHAQSQKEAATSPRLPPGPWDAPSAGSPHTPGHLPVLVPAHCLHTGQLRGSAVGHLAWVITNPLSPEKGNASHEVICGQLPRGLCRLLESLRLSLLGGRCSCWLECCPYTNANLC